MQDYIRASKVIEECIHSVTLDTLPDVCEMLNDFWRDHCEITKRFLFLYYTSHNHAAKGTWAELDHRLRCKIKELRSR